MNASSHDAEADRLDVALRVDQPIRDDGPPGLSEVVDPTEDIANDTTSELAGPGARLRAVPPHTIDSVNAVANDDTAGIATVITSGVMLRDRYILEQPLGYGGTSVVMRAQDLRRAGTADQGADVAIKLLRPEFRDRPECIARLRREFHQTQSVAHPNVVRVYDLDCDRETWFIAMELLVGETLGRRLRRTPPGLPVDEALRIAAACSDALAFAHDHGVTHGDVKPDNVFITATGDVRMLDFGVAPNAARLPSPGDDATSDTVMAAATRAYASPEVLSGQVPEPRDDVFSLSCVIYEMMAGRHPYGRRGAGEARDSGLEIERLPDLSMRQWDVLAAGLAWRREQRPEVRELLRNLGRDVPDLAPVQEVAALPVRIVQGQLMRRSSRKWRIPAVIGLAIVLGVLIGRFAFDTQNEQPQAERLSTPVTADTTAVVSSAGMSAVSGVELPATKPQVAAPSTVPAPAREPLPPGLIAFDAGSMVVSRRSVVAPVPLRHFSRAARSVTVAWRVLDGTAVAGRDYGGPESGVARFSEGHTFRMIYVPILRNAGATGDRSFTVELTDASPGASIGMTRRIVVTIQDDA